jgi:hypothetical protein
MIVVEYNGKFRPPIDWAMPYRSDYVWQGENLTGCSLAAWVKLLRNKGYSIVGCGLPGINAFFVRDDLLGDKFASPFTAENHFEPQRKWICTFR